MTVTLKVFDTMIKWLTNEPTLMPSWKGDGYLAGQENPHLLWNLKVYYCVHKNSPLDSILIQFNPVQNLTMKIHFNIINKPVPSFDKWSLPLLLLTKIL
jgi:hypothetical protein